MSDELSHLVHTYLVDSSGLFQKGTTSAPQQVKIREKRQHSIIAIPAVNFITIIHSIHNIKRSLDRGLRSTSHPEDHTYPEQFEISRLVGQWSGVSLAGKQLTETTPLLKITPGRIFNSFTDFSRHPSRLPTRIKITKWVYPTDPEIGPLVLKLSHSHSSLQHPILKHFLTSLSTFTPHFSIHQVCAFPHPQTTSHNLYHNDWT